MIGTDGHWRRLTELSTESAVMKSAVRPEEFTFKSFDGASVEGWLYEPKGSMKVPLILSVHGGPHGAFGYSYDTRTQYFLSRGYAVLTINPRGSSGYGQRFSDGTLNEWGGGDYKDLMLGVDEALKKHPNLDGKNLFVVGGSYGGFMTNWIVTQTHRFRAAVAEAGPSNLVSFYATSLYQDLMEAEFSGFPWEKSNFATLWKWSPLAHVANVTTPTLLIHGEQDNDVHITQAEEMYTALQRRGMESVLVRYPREGHGNSEPAHRVDEMERVVDWFDRHRNRATQ
jgi:dipeptidyl aminopeptidase/acylaminoacyl peptidase